MSSELLCKDCKHAKVDWTNRILSPFGSYKFAKCTLRKTEDSIDPVTGKVERGDYHYCSTNRTGLSQDACGKEAKFWEPKNADKHLFLRIKHGR